MPSEHLVSGSASGVDPAEGKTLLCESTPADMKPVYLMYAVITAIVVAFQIFIFSRGLFNVFQILIVAAFLASVVYYLVKARRDAGDHLRLYEDHFETQSGSFRYQDIQDMDVGKQQLHLKGKKKMTFYAANAEELARVIRSQRAGGRPA